MLAATAIELIGTVCYRPGWTFEASDYTNRFESAICVKVTYPAPETGRDNWALGYPEQIQARAAFPIQIHDCADAGALFRKVFDLIVEIEIHEAREIFRVKPTGWAPFHPHQVDGMNRWGNPKGDLAFGLV